MHIKFIFFLPSILVLRIPQFYDELRHNQKITFANDSHMHLCIKEKTIEEIKHINQVNDMLQNLFFFPTDKSNIIRF